MKQVLGIYIGDAESSTGLASGAAMIADTGCGRYPDSLHRQSHRTMDDTRHVSCNRRRSCVWYTRCTNSSKYIPIKTSNHDAGSGRRYTRLLQILEAALFQLHYAVEAKWGKKYAIVSLRAGIETGIILPVFSAIRWRRKVIYDQSDESYHRMVPQGHQDKGAFTSEDVVLKQIYLGHINAQTKWSGYYVCMVYRKTNQLRTLETDFLTLTQLIESTHWAGDILIFIVNLPPSISSLPSIPLTPLPSPTPPPHSHSHSLPNTHYSLPYINIPPFFFVGPARSWDGKPWEAVPTWSFNSSSSGVWSSYMVTGGAPHPLLYESFHQVV